ncbi:uncharacterized protein LOC129952221 isoform X2 [Eupeodes corollae]|uniref:uncharacterized protein LOC129952221 isoform X2 n=1 Tax=Eupeodes corollae TaxID=290404 RepID=UPI00248F4F91|nr:uncharacterized protein LOC129952221 isoform X2 [Eupeodes corollae]
MCIQMNRIVLFLFCLNCLCSVKGLSEVSPQVTQVTHVISEDGEPEPIILKCDYDAENYQSSLLVKWLKDGKPIYQWIKGHEPSVFPSSKGLIDEKYEVSNDVNYKYSAIRFPEPTNNISGDYSCMVTMNSTQTIHIHLQIVDVSQLNFKLDYETSSNETLVTCAVENVYPKPSLLITSEDDDINFTKIWEKYDPEINGYFNATSVVSASQFDTNDEITCTLSFLGSEYNKTQTLTSSAAIIKSTALILTTVLVLLLNVY